MNLLFNLEYRTRFGEELIMTVLSGADAEEYRMQTHDGVHWYCEWNRTGRCDDGIDYCYSLRSGDRELRREWLVQPHRLEFVAAKASRYVVYDRWIDIPEDSYLYSSAFAECVNLRKHRLSPRHEARCSVRLKVRAPQLRLGQRLALTGVGEALGNWNPADALPMTEHECNEWVCSIDRERLKSNRMEFKFIVVDENDPQPLWAEGDNLILDLPDPHDGEALVYELAQPYFPIAPWRGAGTVIPVFSLRSEGSFGVGDFGDLQQMIEWVASTGQRALQVLPINDTGIDHTWRDSYPYNAISIYALHPQYIDLRQLPPLADEKERGRFEELRRELNALPQLDYVRVNDAKLEYLRLLFAQEGARTKRTKAYKAFFAQNKDWLEPYARFCYYRDLYGTATFREWPASLPAPDGKILDFWYYVQYNLDSQMRAAHDCARAHHVILKGDIPIGISRDGVEAWVEPRYFNMEGQAGAPPDAFSVNGQNWGFPTYDWDEMLADGCSWWVRRFRKMAEYFDAYRIDHVLGFFRIWEIPLHSVHGLLGQFSPALGMTPAEIEAYGLRWQEERYTAPYISDHAIESLFDYDAPYIKANFLDHWRDDCWRMKPEFDTQRKIERWYAAHADRSEHAQAIRDGLYSLVSDVLFVRDRKDENRFHPRIAVQSDFVYASLSDADKEAFNRLYDDYFYRRNNQYWYQEAMKKLPMLTQSTRMLVCAEDLGMVPECVPWVMNELRILSLEIQSMPKEYGVRFGLLSQNPYRSVCTISTHDMPTLRQWWDEDAARAQEYYNTRLYRGGEAPHPLPGSVAREVVYSHLVSSSMLCLLSLQDWLSIDENLRLPDADAERINIPANPRHYWRWRMHTTIERLKKATVFNHTVKTLIAQSGRK